MNKEKQDELIQRHLEYVRASFEAGNDFSAPEAHMWHGPEDDPHVSIAALFGFTDESARGPLKRMTFDNQAWLVLLHFGAWMIQKQENMSPALKKVIEDAIETGTVDKLMPPLRKEGIVVHVESHDAEIRMFVAEKYKNNGKAVLGPWEEEELILSRPGAKIYLPERISAPQFAGKA